MPRRRDDRVQIAPGIYDDGVQHIATVHVRGAGFREKRFPYGESLEKVEQWRNTERVKLLERARRGTVAGTFARDAQRYLKDFTTHLVSHDTRKIEIGHWVKAFGHDPRGRLTPAAISKVRAQWLKAGTSPKTINNRCDALRHLYHCLDGRKAWTPLDELDDLPVHKTPIRFVENAVILAVDAKLQQLEQQGKIRGPKTRARHRVLTSTGRRPSEVMRAEPGDVNLERRIWLPRDGKGGFSPGVYLNDDMLAAWTFFIEAQAWGHYDTWEHAEKLRLAGWPKDIKPYNARHTVGITLSEGGADLDDVGSMLGHRRRETTRKHYVPVLNSRMQRTSERLEGRFGGWPTVQTSVQNTADQTGKIRPKQAHPKTARQARVSGGKSRTRSMR